MPTIALNASVRAAPTPEHVNCRDYEHEILGASVGPPTHRAYVDNGSIDQAADFTTMALHW